MVALIYSYGGSLLPDAGSLAHKVALAKTQAPALTLFMKGDAVQLAGLPRHLDGAAHRGCRQFIAIWWCLLAFIASGYEHSVANMTLFALSWFGAHLEAYTWAASATTLLWVTLGNTVSGALFMGLGYWYATPKAERPVAVSETTTTASQTQTA